MPTVKRQREIFAYLRKRCDDLIAWLKREDPGCFSQQRHLREGTPERVYWHYGYLTAVRDTLRLFSQSSAKAFRS
jgi:hypothetical protein